MKRILLLALPIMVMCAVSCEKDKVWVDDSPIIRFKDPRFLKALLVDKCGYIEGNPVEVDRNGDGRISEKEASVIDRIFMTDRGIENVEEIKYFTALIDLYCYYNQLTSLDLSNNTALTWLRCGYNQLTSLDVSYNFALTYLDCSGNQLTSLDVITNTALGTLRCYDNQLTSLDVSYNFALTYLDCSDNQLTYLDVSNNTALETLYCNGNPLTKILLNKSHMIDEYDIKNIIEEYGDIIEYVD